MSDRACRLMLSEGVVNAPEADYEGEAVIPRRPWRSPTCEERHQLFHLSQTERRGNSVSVFEVPSRFLREYRSICSSALRTKPSVKAALACNEADALLYAFNEYVAANYSLGGIVRRREVLGGFCVKDAGLASVTTDPTSGRRVGLHVDDWSPFSIEAREAAPMRICANFGYDSRYFLFVNVTVTEMARYLGWGSGSDDAIPRAPRIGMTDVGRCFLRTNNLYPVARLLVKSGEAYIAPTEALLHDGSSIDTRAVDVTCQVRADHATDAG